MIAMHIAGFVVSALLATFFLLALFNKGTNDQGKIVCVLIFLPSLWFAVLNGARLAGLQ